MLFKFCPTNWTLDLLSPSASSSLLLPLSFLSFWHWTTTFLPLWHQHMHAFALETKVASSSFFHKCILMDLQSHSNGNSINLFNIRDNFVAFEGNNEIANVQMHWQIFRFICYSYEIGGALLVFAICSFARSTQRYAIDRHLWDRANGESPLSPSHSIAG